MTDADSRILSTIYEPKTDKRFLIYAKTYADEPIIPSFCIKATTRPSYFYNWLGKKQFRPFKITLYDPIQPNIVPLLEKAANKKIKWNFILNLIGPVGDKVEEWKISGGRLIDVDYGHVDWHSTNTQPLLINLTFKIKNATLVF